MKVCVTGANGQTGSYVVQKLLDGDAESVVPIVRSEAAKKALVNKIGASHEEKVVVSSYDAQSLEGCFQGCQKLVILTSSKPKLVFTSLFGVMFKKFIMREQGTKPSFYFPEGQTPKDVDWLGQKAQIDAAKAAGIEHVVLIGSMGGTDPQHFLNTMGNGKILLWKRKAEVHLMNSGLKYTIIHPGGLLPHYGMSKANCDGGKRELLVAVDDYYLDKETRTIPREDLAEVTIQALRAPEAINTSFDLCSRPEGEGEIFTSLSKLLKSAKSLKCSYDKPDLPDE